MKCYVSTDVGTWTNWLLLSPIRIIIRILSPTSYNRCNAEFYYDGKIQRILHTSVTAAGRGFKMVLFTASRRNTFVGGTRALPSALLVIGRKSPFSMTLNDPNSVFKVTPFFGARYLTNGRIYGHSYYKMWIGNRTQAFEWHQFEWSWVTSNPEFKVTELL